MSFLDDSLMGSLLVKSLISIDFREDLSDSLKVKSFGILSSSVISRYMDLMLRGVLCKSKVDLSNKS